MNKYILLFLVVNFPLALAHAGESHEEEADGKIVELEFLPSEPKAGSATILSFEVNDAEGKSVTHIDGFLDIAKDGEILVKAYELHSHGNQFSMTYIFPEPGEYIAIITVEPSDYYENEKFDPVSVLFYITVREGSTEKNSFLYIVGSIATIGILGVLIFVFKKKKVSLQAQ